VAPRNPELNKGVDDDIIVLYLDHSLVINPLLTLESSLL
jgi:hypothetical protein